MPPPGPIYGRVDSRSSRADSMPSKPTNEFRSARWRVHVGFFRSMWTRYTNTNGMCHSTRAAHPQVIVTRPPRRGGGHNMAPLSHTRDEPEPYVRGPAHCRADVHGVRRAGALNWHRLMSGFRPECADGSTLSRSAGRRLVRADVNQSTEGRAGNASLTQFDDSLATTALSASWRSPELPSIARAYSLLSSTPGWSNASTWLM